MPDPDAHEQRLAADLAAAKREVDELRRREQEIFNAETRERFAVINGSIEKTATELRALKGEVRMIREEQERRDLVNAALVNHTAALGTKKLTRWQTIFAGVAAFVVVGTFVLALVGAVAR